MPNILELQDVQFRWPKSQRDCLKIGHFCMRQGETVFLKGASGSGKTTLLSLIGGIAKPAQGSIKLLEHPFSSFKQGDKDRFRAEHIGFIFQLFNLIPYLTVLENILLSCHFSASRKQKVLAKQVSLEQEACRLLNMFQLDSRTIKHQKVVELSVGQQQRVAAARALIGAPELIIADEPTSALDADTRENFIRCLMQECKQAKSSLLFVSHDASLERYFDRSVLLNKLNQAAQEPKDAD